jgi:hypothetical protein
MLQPIAELDSYKSGIYGGTLMQDDGVAIVEAIG